MNYPLSSIRLRGVLTTLAAFLSLFIMDEVAGASICWSGEQNVVLGLAPGMNITYFDLNGDGTEDFGFRNYEASMTFVPGGDNAGVATSEGGYNTLRPLPPGTAIGQVLAPPYVWMAEEDRLVSYGAEGGGGIWHEVQCGLLGLAFEINGQTHYGWARLSGVSSTTMILHDWAYETQPGVPIKAGARPSLTAAPEVVRPGYLRLKWRREVGKSYRVQATTRMDAPTWTNVFLFGVWITPTQMAVDVRMEGTAQFFRVIEAD